MSVSIYVGRYEVINISNRNFSTLFSALGFDVSSADGLVGQVSGEDLEKALEATPPEMVDRQPTHGIGDKGCMWFEGGIMPEQVDRYYMFLYQGAKNAQLLNLPVTWA